MNINNLFGSLGTSSSTDVGTVGAAVTPTAAEGVAPPVGGTPSAAISTPGQLFSEMQQLSQQNPTLFKTAAAEVAAVFQNAASQASGPEATFLSYLANQFNQSAQTGSLQSPQSTQVAQTTQTDPMAQVVQGPQSPGSSAGAGIHHHHHRHGHGGGWPSQSIEQAAQTSNPQSSGSTQANQATQAGQTAQAVQAPTFTDGGAGAWTRHYHYGHGHGGGSPSQASSVQQAFQSALDTLGQALQGTSSASSTPAESSSGS